MQKVDPDRWLSSSLCSYSRATVKSWNWKLEQEHEQGTEALLPAEAPLFPTSPNGTQSEDLPRNLEFGMCIRNPAGGFQACLAVCL